jgi:hypothetical protein
MRKWILGLVAAIVIGVVAGGITILIDDEAPYVLIGAFWGVLAFFVGAAGAEKYTGGPTASEYGVRR